MGPTSKISDSAGLGWALRVCISNKFLGDAENHKSVRPLGLCHLKRSAVQRNVKSWSDDNTISYQFAGIWRKGFGPVTMKTQWPQWAGSEPLSGGRIWAWTPEALAWLWRKLCRFSNRSVSLGDSER